MKKDAEEWHYFFCSRKDTRMRGCHAAFSILTLFCINVDTKICNGHRSYFRSFVGGAVRPNVFSWWTILTSSWVRMNSDKPGHTIFRNTHELAEKKWPKEFLHTNQKPFQSFPCSRAPSQHSWHTMAIWIKRNRLGQHSNWRKTKQMKQTVGQKKGRLNKGIFKLWPNFLAEKKDKHPEHTGSGKNAPTERNRREGWKKEGKNRNRDINKEHRKCACVNTLKTSR